MDTPTCPKCGRPTLAGRLSALLAVEGAARAILELDLEDPRQRGEVRELLATALAELEDS